MGDDRRTRDVAPTGGCFRFWRISACAFACGLQQWRNPLLEDPRSTSSRRCYDLRIHHSRSLWRFGHGIFAAVSQYQHAGEHRATTRDALYGWTAERLVRKQAALGDPELSLLFRSRIPSGGRCRPTCLSRQRIALCLRHHGYYAAALAENSSNSRGGKVFRRHVGLLELVC
jgi:hypothetical protein